MVSLETLPPQIDCLKSLKFECKREFIRLHFSEWEALYQSVLLLDVLSAGNGDRIPHARVLAYQ